MLLGKYDLGNILAANKNIQYFHNYFSNYNKEIYGMGMVNIAVIVSGVNVSIHIQSYPSQH